MDAALVETIVFGQIGELTRQIGELTLSTHRFDGANSPICQYLASCKAMSCKLQGIDM